MKKNNLLLALLISTTSFAQQFLYTGSALVANTYPFGNANNNLRQAIYHPADFPTAPSGNITAIYLLKSTSGAPNITNMTIKMGNTNLQTFPNGDYVQGLQTVYVGAYNDPLVNGNYMKITLQNPIPFDNTQNFVLELSQTGYTTSASIMQVNGGVVGRSIFGSASNTSGTVQDRLPVLGFDLQDQLSTHNISPLKKASMVYPNPASDKLHISDASDGARYKIYSLVGTMITEGNVKNKTIQVSNLLKGTYIISVSDKGKEVVNTKFIKN